MKDEILELKKGIILALEYMYDDKDGAAMHLLEQLVIIENPSKFMQEFLTDLLNEQRQNKLSENPVE